MSVDSGDPADALRASNRGSADSDSDADMRAGRDHDPVKPGGSSRSVQG